MSVTVTSILNNVFNDIREESDGSGAVTREVMLLQYNRARRRLQREVNIIKGNFVIQAVTNQIFYDLPLDYKSNLRRIEHDFVPLELVNLARLDDYDTHWRNPNERNPPDTVPKFFVLDEPDRKFIVYPPPAVTGDHVSITGDGSLESITIGGETIDLSGEAGIIETIELGGVVYNLTGENGILETLTTPVDNLSAYYDKHFINLTTEIGQNLDIDLEGYQEAIEYFIKKLIYELPNMLNTDQRAINTELFNSEIKLINRETLGLKPPMSFSVKRKPGRMWGRRR